ncbi:hypothetical protein ACFQ8S_14770 [Streptomyces virginiae]|uniref:hypothetical protein n=1 Tax=Streptomyces virginiae TaxID=1961 RepID=UPI0036819E5A
MLTVEGGDGEQVRLGRRVARSGAVGAVSVRPGGLTAVVRDRDGTAQRTDVLVQQFSQAEWDRLLGLAAAEPGHIAALLAARHRGLRPLAWGFGAAPGLASLEDDWTPDRTALARARTALPAAWAEEEAPVLRRVRARWTSPGTGRQIRLGREGRWWPYRREAGRWVPSGPPAPDPASGLAAADAAD